MMDELRGSGDDVGLQAFWAFCEVTSKQFNHPHTRFVEVPSFAREDIAYGRVCRHEYENAYRRVCIDTCA